MSLDDNLHLSFLLNLYINTQYGKFIFVHIYFLTIAPGYGIWKGRIYKILLIIIDLRTSILHIVYVSLVYMHEVIFLGTPPPQQAIASL